jgi:two-component system LytT family response regulator
MTIRTLIVDDEPPAREGIRLRLMAEADIEIVGELGSARAAMAAIEENAPDLLFLDVQMPGMSGIEMLHAIGPDRIPAVVLVTAFEEHALDAFEVSVVDYILKPIDTERFQLALDRARVRLERVRAVKLSGQIKSLINSAESPTISSPLSETRSQAASPDHLSRFLVADGDGERPVRAADVDWIEAAGDYVRLHEGGSYHLYRAGMNQLEALLDPRLFGRVHRSAIVRFDRIDEIVPVHHGDAEIRLSNGATVRLSRSYRERFRQALSVARQAGTR